MSSMMRRVILKKRMENGEKGEKRGEKGSYHQTRTCVINAAGEVALPIVKASAFRLSSQAFNAFNNWIILSRFPNRTSLMLTLPIFTSLSNKKSKSLNSPSSLSSWMSVGNAELGTGGEDGWPLMDSARRRSSRPEHMKPVDSLICRDSGRWVFAHTIRELSVWLI